VLSRSRVSAKLPFEGLASAPGFHVKKCETKKARGKSRKGGSSRRS